MSIVNKSSATTAAAGVTAAEELPMLTPEEVIEQLRAMRARIPQFVQLPRERRSEHLRRLARVNPEFAREAFSAVGASPVVQSVIGNTSEELIEAADLMTRWSLAENEMRATLSGLSASNFLRRQQIGEAAVETYTVSRQLARREEHAELVPHVEQMKRLPRYGSRRVRPAAPQPQAPAPLPGPIPPTKTG